MNLGPNTDHTIVIGLGEVSDLTRNHYVKAAPTAANILKEKGVSKVSAQVRPYGCADAVYGLQAPAEGFLLADYSFDEYRSEKPSKALEEVSLLSESNTADTDLNEIINLLKAINFTRDLVNTPANDLYPQTLADEMFKALDGTDVDIEVFGKKALTDSGTEALLAVSQGSAREPRMLVLKYLPLGEDEPVVCLVGKGVTYASGGYAIKSAKGMVMMMVDMAGAASCVG